LGQGPCRTSSTRWRGCTWWTAGSWSPGHAGRTFFYIPGGKREGTESDLQALQREIAEELTVTLLTGTVRHTRTYRAHQPGGHPAGAIVRMSCYTGGYSGTLAPSSEIAELAWFCYADRPRVPAVDQLLFDDLRAAGQLH